mgnify:CR=1 FL=1
MGRSSSPAIGCVNRPAVIGSEGSIAGRCGTGQVDITVSIRRLLVEGGGVTVSRFLAAGLLDRLHLTVAPVLAGGDGRRIVTGPDLPLDRWRRRMVLGDDEGYLYTRWAR